MTKRAYLIAAVNAELKAKLDIAKFDKEFGNGNQNTVRQNNPPSGNVPQQPVYGG